MGRSTTDDHGRCTFTHVAAGAYAVFAEREGFEAATATGSVGIMNGAWRGGGLGGGPAS